MHILNIEQSGDLYTDQSAIDLAQPQGDIIFFTATDTDIQLISNAAHRENSKEETPSYQYRIANLQTLSHPYSVDLYLEKTCARAKFIFVRMLGGVAYWPYGVEQLTKHAKAIQAHLIFLSGDGNEDADLRHHSNLSTHDYNIFMKLANASGAQNISTLFKAIHALLQNKGELKTQDFQIKPPLMAGIYWPGLPFTSLPDLSKNWQKNAPIIAIIFYRALYLADDLAAIDALTKALQAQGLNPLPLYVASLKDAQTKAIIHEILNTAKADLILNATAFALLDGVNANYHNEAPAPLNHYQAPIIQITLSASNHEAWKENSAGLTPRDLAMQVVLPELDGRIYGHIFGFKSKAKRDPLTHAMRVKSEAFTDGIQHICALSKNWIALRKIPNSDKRIAMIMANYPNRDGRIANGVGLDTPQSVFNSIQILGKKNYHITDFPKDSAKLIQRLKDGVTNQGWQGRKIETKLLLKTYQSHFANLPISIQKAMIARWGDISNDPQTKGDYICLPLIQFGNICVGIQPARGYQIDPKSTYHSSDLVPPHHYLAFYFYLRHEMKIHAVLHFGKHGNLEWLPGKALALSKDCYPSAILGATPHLYPFIVNDPGEGSQAKRRNGAVILDHLIPSIAQAEQYGSAYLIECKMDEYYEAQGLDQPRAKLLKQEILDLCHIHGLAQDCGLNEQDDVSENLLKIDNYLCELKELQIRDGLHIFGTCPNAHLANQTLAAILRQPRGQDLFHDTKKPQSGLKQSLMRAIAHDLNLEFDPLTAERATPFNDVIPKPLRAYFPKTIRHIGHVVTGLDKVALDLITADLQTIGSHSTAIINYELPKIRQDFCISGKIEMDNLCLALDGKYISPGPSGAPSRGKPEILPTGRNFFSIDSRALPTPAAWQLGFASANAVIDRYLQDHGEYPKNLTLSAWGTSNMRTGGDDIAQAMALIGAKPQWDVGGRRVTGFEILPLSLLARPRIDVTLRISGFFRDAFPSQISLMDLAMQAIMDLDEDIYHNPLKANQQELYQQLIKDGNDEETAQTQSRLRIFSTKAGSYGAGLQAMIDEDLWQDRKDFADAFLSWSSYGYGDQHFALPARSALESRLKKSDAILHNQDNREHDILDSDDYYQFEGGLSASIFALSGKDVAIYHNDHSLPEKPIIRNLEHEIGMVVQGRAANPKWIKGVMRHGYKGAFEIAATVDYLFAFAATTNKVKAHHFEKCFVAYLEDDTVREFLAQQNIDAYYDIIKRFQMAIERGLWQPKTNHIHEKLTQLNRLGK